jgi:hypothetical protein
MLGLQRLAPEPAPTSRPEPRLRPPTACRAPPKCANVVANPHKWRARGVAKSPQVIVPPVLIDGVVYITAKSVPLGRRAPLAHRRYSCGCGACHRVSANIYAGPGGCECCFVLVSIHAAPHEVRLALMLRGAGRGAGRGASRSARARARGSELGGARWVRGQADPYGRM